MLLVCFAGITGWTAPPIVAADDLQLVAERPGLRRGLDTLLFGEPPA